MQNQYKVVIVTGGFDPIHSGHIAYLEAAKSLGDQLVVGLNSDEWLARKKGQPFMPFDERLAVMSRMNMVDWIINFDDSDGSAKWAIYATREKFPDATIIFANGGDRTSVNIPEMDVEDSNVEFVFGVGGEDKKNSSSWILEEWKNPKTKRPWGWYRVLDDKPNYKVKELVVEPGQKLSMQRHQDRAEHWYVLKGKCDIVTDVKDDIIKVSKSANETYVIGQNVWHQCQNNYDEPCHILEVQYGTRCVEEDIERKDA